MLLKAKWGGESGALLTTAAAQRVSATTCATRTPRTFTFIFLTYCKSSRQVNRGDSAASRRCRQCCSRPLSLTGRRYRTFSSDPRANFLHRGVYATMVHHFLYSCVHSDKEITRTGIPWSIHIYHKNIMWVVSPRNFHPVVVQDTLNNTVRFAVIKDGQRRNCSLRGHITEHSNLPEKSGHLSLE